eukprot:5245453-Heterocapsa_arctica.AAC.1
MLYNMRDHWDAHNGRQWEATGCTGGCGRQPEAAGGSRGQRETESGDSRGQLFPRRDFIKPLRDRQDP